MVPAKVHAVVHVITGFGKAAGFSQVQELGVLETPIALTETLSIGAVHEGLVLHAMAANPELPGGGLDGAIARMRFSGLAQLIQSHFHEAKSFEVGCDRASGRSEVTPVDNKRCSVCRFGSAADGAALRRATETPRGSCA